MTRMRVYGILADYADQNDHDVLRSDPVFKLVCDRSIEDDDLASQPTLSRFENAIDVQSFFRLRDVLMDQFIASFDQPPTTCWPECVATSPSRPRNQQTARSQPKRCPAVVAGNGTTSAASTIRWARASLVPGAHA